jgi:hypothetical protein
MALVNFSNLDFEQIKISIKDYLRSNSNFTDYDFEGSNMSVIIDMLAYNTYINSFNANMLSNEVFIDSATLRENVVSLASNIGYLPKSKTSARGTITFSVDTSTISSELTPSTITLKKGTVCTSLSSYNGETYTFIIKDDVTVPVQSNIASFNDIQIYEGSYLVNTFTVNSYEYRQRFILDNPNIDTSLISVSVRGASEEISYKFNLVDNLTDVTPTSKVFFVREIEDQRYELIFGDGQFGQKLNNGDFIEVSYVVTNGELGNGIPAVSFSGRLYDNNGRNITDGISFTTLTESTKGGNDIESVDSIRKYAPKLYSTQNRAVTPSDYETIVPLVYPEIDSVSSFGGEELSPPQFGKVFLSIKPKFGAFLSNSTKDEIRRKLKKYSVSGIGIEILDLKYLYLEINSYVYYNSNTTLSTDQLAESIRQNVKSYSESSDLNKYGARFKYSKFQKLIDNTSSSITSNITTVQIRRDLRPVLNKYAEYEICFGNEFYSERTDGYNIKSSGFKVDGISSTVYISDKPTKGTTYGNVFLFTLDIQNNPQILKSSVGTIDYKKGEIKINPINIVSTLKNTGGEPIIEISAIPTSNDVIGLQDLYLQLNLNDFNVETRQDNIESGYDISGTNYITTSSYVNGDPVRS